MQVLGGWAPKICKNFNKGSSAPVRPLEITLAHSPCTPIMCHEKAIQDIMIQAWRTPKWRWKEVRISSSSLKLSQKFEKTPAIVYSEQQPHNHMGKTCRKFLAKKHLQNLSGKQNNFYKTCNSLLGLGVQIHTFFIWMLNCLLSNILNLSGFEPDIIYKLF